MAKSIKPVRSRRPLRKASRVAQKTSRPKVAAGLKKAPARKRLAASRPSAMGAPRVNVNRVAPKPSLSNPSAIKPAPANAPAAKWVYAFGGGKAEGKAKMRDLLGGKGANLAEMSNLGLPVPPGFTITTAVCTHFYENRKTYPKDLKKQVEAALARLGKLAGKNFGDRKNPLLVSVRSGARASMPGMMDTVLNLGLND